jgi:thiamine kinase-like enzyme
LGYTSYAPHQFDSLSGANSQLLQIVKQYPEFQMELDALSTQWQINSLIHGDMKWDNCLVHSDDAQHGELHLKVVDWELADFGDACWDVGSILQAYLSFWLLSLHISEEAAPERWIELARYPLEDMQPAVQAFWDTYTETIQSNGAAANQLLERSVKYGAARMIQSAFEYMTYSPQITPNALCMLQVSINVLMRPKEAIGELLGMQI